MNTTHPALYPDTWTEAAPDQAVMIADGQLAKVTVRHGRLQVEDGVPGHRRNRQIPKVPRTVTRLVILARHGYITLEALRWLQALRIQVTHIAEDITMTSGSGEGDWRILRAQAERGTAVTRWRKDLVVARFLVSRKIENQAGTLDDHFGANRTSVRLRSLAANVTGNAEGNIEFIRGAEGIAAAHYWDVWKGQTRIWWSPADLLIVPPHWRAFPGRPTLKATTYESNRHATDPINAMLNYAYKVLESETLTACRIFGLHPDLGVLHAGGTDRHAFVLDLMEPVRPFCDKLVLKLIESYQPPKYFDRRWMHEEKDGRCVLDPPLTHAIANWAADIGAVVRDYTNTVREVYRNG